MSDENENEDKVFHAGIIPDEIAGAAPIEVAYHKKVGPIGRTEAEWKTLYLFGRRIATWRV